MPSSQPVQKCVVSSDPCSSPSHNQTAPSARALKTHMILPRDTSYRRQCASASTLPSVTAEVRGGTATGKGGGGGGGRSNLWQERGGVERVAPASGGGPGGGAV